MRHSWQGSNLAACDQRHAKGKRVGDIRHGLGEELQHFGGSVELATERPFERGEASGQEGAREGGRGDARARDVIEMGSEIVRRGVARWWADGLP